MAMSNNFEKNVKQQLDMSLKTLDAATQSQLSRARYKALAGAKNTKFKLSHRFGGLTAAAALTLLVITVMPTLQSPANLLLETSPDWVLMSDIELYQDLEFYQWLDETSESKS